eukprot:3075498-Pyramimonas_sp.AAC.1
MPARGPPLGGRIARATRSREALDARAPEPTARDLLPALTTPWPNLRLTAVDPGPQRYGPTAARPVTETSGR